MKQSKNLSRACPNPDCPLSGQSGKGNFICHSFYITTQGRRRRYRCKECGRTFCSTYGTPYCRLHKPRSLFDEMIHMCVHGIGISAMARIKQLAWGTVARCTESLVGHMALLTTYYNFVRPHMALQFGKRLRTPAMQAGLAKNRLSFREIFTGRAAFFLFVLIVVVPSYGRLKHKSSR